MKQDRPRPLQAPRVPVPPQIPGRLPLLVALGAVRRCVVLGIPVGIAAPLALDQESEDGNVATEACLVEGGLPVVVGPVPGRGASTVGILQRIGFVVVIEPFAQGQEPGFGIVIDRCCGWIRVVATVEVRANSILR